MAKVKTSKTGFIIESDIEIPASKGGYSMYSFDELEVGQSFFVEWKTASDMCPHYAQFKGTEKKFTSRTISNDNEDGTRIWRTA